MSHGNNITVSVVTFNGAQTMCTHLTAHAHIRQQQRGIPNVVRDWLIDYGCTQYDGHGGIQRFFNRRSLQRLESDFGAKLVARMSENLRAYLVQSSRDGLVITMGKRYQGRRIWRH